ncbi:hypothetical protein H1R20_g2862, partial [Candolleomyces eurysporus]
MARTKRSSQLSAGAKSGSQPKGQSPEYVPDDYELVEPPATQARASPATPTPSSSKKRVRADVNPTPPPAKKKSKTALSQATGSAIVVPDSLQQDDDDEDNSSSTTRSVSDTTEAMDADIEDDVETPKPTQAAGKKKATNLKTQLGGRLGTNVFDAHADADHGTTPIVTLPSSDFTRENKEKWASSYVDGNKTHLFVKARASDDALLVNKAILDPYMLKHGYYKDLPNANKLQLYSVNERQGLEFTDGNLSSLVPGLSIETWDCFGIERSYVAGLHRFKRQGVFANASTVDVTELVFKETYSNQGPGGAYIAAMKHDGKPVVFVMVGAIMESFIVHGKNVGLDGKAPFARGIIVLGHRFEYERWSCTLATLWQAEDIFAPIQRRHITLQTHNRSNHPTTDASSDTAKVTEVKKGKMVIRPYLSPTKPKTSVKTQTYINFTEEIPVYDGRNQAFEPEDIAGSLARLPKFVSDDGEIPEGSGVVVGYCAATSKFLSIWKLTLYIQWIVVVAV